MKEFCIFNRRATDGRPYREFVGFATVRRCRRAFDFLHGYIVGEGSPLPQKDQISHSREAKRLPYKGFFAFCDSPSMPSRPWRFHKVSLHLNKPLPLGEVAHERATERVKTRPSPLSPAPRELSQRASLSLVCRQANIIAKQHHYAKRNIITQSVTSLRKA